MIPLRLPKLAPGPAVERMALVLMALLAPVPSTGAPDVLLPPDQVLRWQPRTAEEAGRPFGLPAGHDAVVLRPLAGESAPRARDGQTFLDGTWSELGPPPRVRATLAHDAAADRLVSFGGSEGRWWLNSVWSRAPGDDAPWERLDAGGDVPPTDREHAGAFDALHRRLIVVTADSVLRVRVLGLQGPPRWMLLDATGAPPGRSRPAVAYDPVRDAVVVHGGRLTGTFGPCDEIWTLSLSGTPHWSRLEPTGASVAALDHALVYDSLRDRMVVFRCGELPSLTAFTLGSGSAWGSVATADPPCEPAPRCVYDPAADELLIALGNGETIAISLADGGQRVLAPANSIDERRGVALALDSVRHRLILQGGSTFNQFTRSATLALPLAGGAWSDIGPYAPAPRMWHMAALDRFRHRMVVFGGWPLRGDTLATLSLGTSAAWAPLVPVGSARPRLRFGASFVYDEVGDRMLLFGGQATDGTGDFLDDLWSLSLADPPSWTQIAAAGVAPGVHRFHGALWDAPRQRLLIAGGDDGAEYTRDAWQATIANDRATWTNVVPRGELPWMYSNLYALPDADEAWALSWPNALFRVPLAGAFAPTVIAPGGLTPPSGFQLIGFDERRQRLLGSPTQSAPGAATFEELWSLPLGASAAWGAEPTGGSLPPRRFLFAGIYDGVNDRLVLHGGYDDDEEYFSDTWALGWDQPTAVRASLVSAAADAHGTRIEWRIEGASIATVQQRSTPEAWGAIATLVVGGDGRLPYEGPALGAGQRRSFRLALGPGGSGPYAGEVSLEAPIPTSLSLAGALRNPCEGELIVTLAMSPHLPAALELLDLSGRRLERLALPPSPSGPRQVGLAARGAHPPGVYFVRLQQGREVRLARVAIVR